MAVSVCLRAQLMDSWGIGALSWLKNVEWYLSADTVDHIFSLLEYKSTESSASEHTCICVPGTR